MRSNFFFPARALAATAVFLAPTLSYAEQGKANIALSLSDPFSMTGSEENCLLSHQTENGAEKSVLSIAEKATGADVPGKSLQLTIGADETGYVDDLQIGYGAQNFQSLTPAAKIVMEAEAAEGQRPPPGFSDQTITVNGVPFSEYVKNIRATEKFPAMRTSSISVKLTGIDVYEVSEGATIGTSDVSYNGDCKVAIMIE